MIHVYRFDDGASDKIWAYEQLSPSTYRVFWGKTGSQLSSKVIEGDGSKKSREKVRKGYVSVGGTIVGCYWKKHSPVVASETAATPPPKRLEPKADIAPFFEGAQSGSTFF